MSPPEKAVRDVIAEVTDLLDETERDKPESFVDGAVKLALFKAQKELRGLKEALNDVKNGPTRQDEPPPQVWVQDPCYRGVMLKQLVDFFKEECGTITFEDELEMQPMCVATKLASKCLEFNMESRQQIAAGFRRELLPNLYAVEELLIRPATKEQRVSYSELWNGSNGLLITNFISHFWGEDFGEFVQSTYRYALHLVRSENPGLSIAQVRDKADQLSFYICAFSNNQWNIAVELGDGVEDSPFHKVLQAETTVKVLMNLDQCGAALLRVWCAFEFFLAQGLQKHFAINTRYGPLQEISIDSKTAEAWVIHMFDILQKIDISKAMASKEEDLLLIQDHISKFEGTGIAKGKKGTVALNMILRSLIADQVLPLLAKTGNAEAVKLAIGCGANPNIKDLHFVQPLTHVVAKWGADHDAARELVAAGADLRAKEEARAVVGMFDNNPKERKMCIDRVRGLTGEVGAYYRQALDAAEKREAADLMLLQIQRLADTDSRVRDAAVETIRLAKLGEGASQHIPALMQHLKNNEAQVRILALETLKSLGTSVMKWAADLAGCIVDEDVQVRQSAVNLVARLGEHAAEDAPAFAKYLGKTCAAMQTSVLQALSELGPSAAQYLQADKIFPENPQRMVIQTAGGVALRDIALELLAAALPREHLTSLELSFPDNEHFKDEGLQCLFSNLPPNLRVLILNFHKNRHFGDAVLEQLAVALPSCLEELQLDFHNSRKFSDEGLKSLAQRIPAGLRVLRLDFHSSERFGDEGLMQLVAGLPAGLCRLSLDFCWNEKFTDVGIVEFAKKLPSCAATLQRLSLDLHCNEKLTDEALICLCEGLPQGLTDLRLVLSYNKNFTDDALRQLARKFPSGLKGLHLDFRCNENFTENALDEVKAQVPPNLVTDKVVLGFQKLNNAKVRRSTRRSTCRQLVV